MEPAVSGCATRGAGVASAAGTSDALEDELDELEDEELWANPTR
jgi:hypothetical protein